MRLEMSPKRRKQWLFLFVYFFFFAGSLYLRYLGIEGPWTEGNPPGAVALIALVALVFAWLAYSAVLGCGAWVLYVPAGIGVCFYLFGVGTLEAIAGLLLGVGLTVVGDRALKPAWRSNSKKRRLAAIDGIGDQTKLARIALEAKHSDASLRAIGNLSDPLLLSGLIEREKSEELKETFGHDIEKFECAARKRIGELRHQEIQAIEDPQVLRQIVEGEDDFDLRLVALSRIDDSEILTEFALESPQEVVRKAAIERISDDRVLATIATTDSSESVWREAYERLKDEVLRTEVRSVRFLPTPTRIRILYLGPMPNEAWVAALIEKCQGLLTEEQILIESGPEYERTFAADRETFVRTVRESMKVAGGFSIDVLVLDQREGRDTAALATWTGAQEAIARSRL